MAMQDGLLGNGDLTCLLKVVEECGRQPDLAAFRESAVELERPGSGAAEAVTVERQVAAVPVAARSYGECMTMLGDGRIDAITTNDTILAGLKTRQGADFRLLNSRFGERRTGIAIRKGDPDGCEALNKAITEMYQDGTMARLMRTWFGTSGLDLSDVEVPQFRRLPVTAA